MLSHTELLELVASGVIEHASLDAVNASSLDLHLGPVILAERFTDGHQRVSLKRREQLATSKHFLTPEYPSYVLRPGECVLAQTREVFHLPNHLTGEYYLKSSMARIFLEHMHAGHMDPGWHGSVLTLEFKNLSNYHEIELNLGDRIGQAVFFRVAEVGEHASYANTGSYNNKLETAGVSQK